RRHGRQACAARKTRGVRRAGARYVLQLYASGAVDVDEITQGGEFPRCGGDLIPTEPLVANDLFGNRRGLRTLRGRWRLFVACRCENHPQAQDQNANHGATDDRPPKWGHSTLTALYPTLDG